MIFNDYDYDYDYDHDYDYDVVLFQIPKRG